MHAFPSPRKRMIVPAIALALAGGMAAAPVLAQDAGTGASGKRFAIVGGFAHQDPTGDATIDGLDADVDGSAAATVSASWYLNDHVAFEGWGAATKFDHRVSTSEGNIATVNSQPWALSAQYHFRDGNEAIRPFVGLGYYQSNFSDEDQNNAGPYADNHIGIETASGPMATVGVDLNFTENVFARADMRYLHGDQDIEVDGATAGDAELNPVVVGFGIGARF